MSQQQLPAPVRSQPLATPSTTSLLDEKARSQAILATPPATLDYATKAAKLLVGQIPGPPVDDPLVYANGIARALEGYPVGVVQECYMTKTGLPSQLERRPLPKQVIDWCEKRMAYHRSMASYAPRPAKAEPVYSEEHKATMREKLAALAAELRERMRKKWWLSEDELHAKYPPQKEAAE